MTMRILGFVALGIVLFVTNPTGQNLPAQEPAQDDGELPALLKAKALTAGPKDDDLRKLLIARYNASWEEVQTRTRQFQAGKTFFSEVMESGRRFVHAALEVYDQPADQLRLLEDFLDMSKKVEKIQKVKFDNGILGPAEYYQARYFRLDAEIQWLRAKRQMKPSKG